MVNSIFSAPEKKLSCCSSVRVAAAAVVSGGGGVESCCLVELVEVEPEKEVLQVGLVPAGRELSHHGEQEPSG